MIIAIAGYNGLIGRRFVQDRKEDHLIRLSRDLLYGDINQLSQVMEGADLVVNLAGSPINTRWTRHNRKKIEQSRHGVNTRLVEAINRMEKRPEIFLTASAVGIYETGKTHDENRHKLAENYLAKVVKMWEAPLEKLSDEVNAVRLRIGIVLGRGGGALKPFLLAYRIGILPIMGSGKQVYSFIHLEDLNAAIRFIIHSRQNGIYNLCAPHPVDNTTFTRSLAKIGRKKWVIRVPVFMLRLVFGEAHIVVTEGPRVLPARLLREGFGFNFPDIDSALVNLVKKR
jgi:uncharacterized protein (TIGR01777 family)